MQEWKKIGPAEKVPVELREIWGGEFGCPVFDTNNVCIGWAERMPNGPGEKIEAISLDGVKVEICS